MTGTTTLSLINARGSLNLYFVNTGAFTLNWPSTVTSPPTVAASTTTLVSLNYNASLGSWFASSGSSSGSGTLTQAKFQRVQTKAYANVTSSPATNAFTSNVGVGHLLIAVVTDFGGNASLPTDTLGSAWKQIGSVTGSGANDYLFEAVTTGSGADTVSMVFTGSRAYLSIAEYSGQAGSGVIADTVSANSLTGTSLTAPLYVAYNGELLISLFQNASSNETYSNFGGGLTLQQTVAAGNAAWGDNLSSAAGLNTGTATMSISDTWISKTWAFLPAGLSALPTGAFVRTTEAVTKDVGSPPTSPAVVSYATGNTPGDTILIFETQYFGLQDQTTSIQDSNGDVFIRIAQGAIPNNGNNCWGAIYAAQNITGGTASNTLTVNFVGLADAMEIFSVEIQGGESVDTQLLATAGSGPSVTGTLTLANTGEQVYILSSSITTGTITGTGLNLTNYGISSSTPNELMVSVLNNPTIGGNTITQAVAGANGISELAVGLIPNNINTKILPAVVQSSLFAANGTACTTSQFAISAGWGSTATVSAATGDGQNCYITISSSGTGQAANATVTWNLPNPLPTSPVTPVGGMELAGGTVTGLSGTGILANQTIVSATAPVFTFAGLPVAGTTTIFHVWVGP
jgi:hypothetical protein